jgi:hypothetical protein
MQNVVITIEDFVIDAKRGREAVVLRIDGLPSGTLTVIHCVGDQITLHAAPSPNLEEPSNGATGEN